MNEGPVLKIIGKYEQGSPEWIEVRRGMFTASEFHSLLTARPETLERIRQTKLAELKGAVVKKPFTSIYTEWGKVHEAQGRAQVCLELEELGVVNSSDKCIVPGLVIQENRLWVGASADGLFLEKQLGVEIKCPYKQDNHVNHFKPQPGNQWINGIPKKYYTQVQGGMLVTGWKYWVYASFDPRLLVDGQAIPPLFIKMLRRDEEYIKPLAEKLNYIWKSMNVNSEVYRRRHRTAG